MNLHHLLAQRAAAGRPVRVALLGAGKFGTMFLAQARHTPGLQIVAIADLRPDAVRRNLAAAGWPAAQLEAANAAAASAGGATWLTDDATQAIAADGVEVVIEATGDPRAGTAHALAAIAAGRHVVMVTVEADVLVGPLLARRAAQAGVVYSLAYGDQPALICELVDWARACGFAVVCAGKGTRYLPAFHQSTPATVWQHYGITAEQAAAAGMNAKMFNSFIDGTKSSIEMAAVANACDLAPPAAGLAFPPCEVDALAELLRPAAEGGQLAQEGTVEVVADLTRDGRPLARDLRWGVYVTFRAPHAYASQCFRQYGVAAAGDVAALYRPVHMIGLELGISVAAAALRGEPTGCPHAWRAEVAAVAKRDLQAGERLDGEGGATVWGKLQPAASARAAGLLPLGLANDVTLTRAVAAGATLRQDDVALPADDPLLALRRTMLAEIAWAS